MDFNLQEVLDEISSVNFMLDEFHRYNIITPNSSPDSYDRMSSTSLEGCDLSSDEQYVTLTPVQSPIVIDGAVSEIPDSNVYQILVAPNWQEIGSQNAGSYTTLASVESCGQDYNSAYNQIYDPVKREPNIVEYFSTFVESPSAVCDENQKPVDGYVTYSIASPVEETPTVSSQNLTISESTDEQSIEVPQNKLHRMPRRINRFTYDTKLYCKLCEKEFGRKASLQLHNVIYHASARPFRCETCGKYFVTEAQLAKHKLNHDPKNKKFSCSQCEKSYVHVKDRDRHFTAHHGTPAHQCKYCRKRFTRRDHMLAHEQAHEDQGSVELHRGRRRRKMPGGNGKLMAAYEIQN
ncbi:zinc finger protein 681-like [Wyeomyia smithii]|uniref:zinc finger protein 681-like n=1 Tax=Wyeomyia smithii TaxID=174621 RepID=UPI0024680C06|nr:zinc finger protein 681-like [Wyeomyia smithii]